MMTNIINETVIANNNVILIVSIFYDLLTCIKCNAIFRTVEASNSLETSNNVILKETKCDDICLSPECIHIASQVLKNMNPKVEPCDDFYKFACGGFLESTFIPDDQNTVNTISTINDNIQKQRRLILEQDSPPNELRPFKLAKDFYKSCINKTAIEQRGLTLLLNNLKELGGWPVLDSEGSWNENDFTWMDSVYRFRRFGHSFCYFIGFKVMTSYNSTENYSKRWISLFRASFGLSRKYLINGLDDKFVQAYYDYMVDIAVILGAKLSQARTELKESLKFEIKLANISFDEKPSPNNSMTLNQLSAAYPSIPWQEYFNTILAPQGQLNQNDTISVHHPGYLKNFILLISTTPKRVQANYAFWRAIAATIKYYETDDIWKIRLKYLSNLKLNGKQNRQPRWKECIDIISEGKKLLYVSVESMYVRKYFKEDAKKIVLEMANDVKQEFTMILKKADWMDEETKSYILEKTAATTINIAYPDELLNNKKLEEFYEKLELNADDYIGNIFNLSNFETNLEFSKLTMRQPWNKTEWIKRVKPAAANAFYLWLENEIEVNVGIMQGIFFNDERPHYMNYGGIGVVIAHEITHSFDDPELLNEEDSFGLESEIKKRYRKRADCFIHQYGNYTAEEVGLNLNATNTLRENIADNGGIKKAYYAYKEWVKRNKPEQRLPGLLYSPEQMFWISMANSWCTKNRPKELKRRIMMDSHSPDEFRIRGSLSNMEEFSRDFNCPIGSRMNPEKKCIMW